MDSSNTSITGYLNTTKWFFSLTLTKPPHFQQKGSSHVYIRQAYRTHTKLYMAQQPSPNSVLQHTDEENNESTTYSQPRESHNASDGADTSHTATALRATIAAYSLISTTTNFSENTTP
jgi:hypothetical protein